MPAKWKESEVVVPRDQRGRIMRTDNPVKTYTHYYLKQTPSAELIEYLNGYSSKPKKVQIARTELVRRGYKVFWKPKVAI
jgi:hypothetical protein